MLYSTQRLFIVRHWVQLYNSVNGAWRKRAVSALKRWCCGCLGIFAGKSRSELQLLLPKGYEIKTVKDSKKCSKFLTDWCAVCVLEDGTEVEVTELMNLSFEETVCGDGTCGIPENFNTCPRDCPSGGMDGYCDGVSDGICDPDCTSSMDPVCVSGAEEFGTLLKVLVTVACVIALICAIVLMLRKRG